MAAVYRAVPRSRRPQIQYAAVTTPNQGNPAIKVGRIPPIHHVVARIATSSPAPSAEVYG